MPGFNITYEIVTPESAEHGDAAERGFLAEGLTLRDAYAALRFDGRAVEDNGDWITFAPDTDFATAAETTKALHLPRDITPSSAARVKRLFGLAARALPAWPDR